MSRPTPDRLFEEAAIDSLLSLDGIKVRVFVLLGGVGLLALLALTRWLTPDARGLGTHEQLGLPPCGFYLWYGLPCPSCGMTTSWAWLARGDIFQAAHQHFGGALLGVYSLLLGSWLVISAVRGRWLGGWPSSLTWAVKFSVLTLAILITWIVKLWA
jgi:hypothetical protein